MEFVKKPALGGYKPVDIQDPELTHVILERAEYVNIVNQIAQERRSRELAEENTRKVQAEARERLQKAENDAQKTIQGLQDALEAQKREAERQAALNANLLRIARERSNADRGLQPKRLHSGYAVVASAEKNLRYKGSRKMDEVMLWETTLQLPHVVDLPEDQVRMLLPEVWPHLRKIGVTDQYAKGYEAMMKDPAWRSRQENILLQHRLKANYKAGYWELILQHTQPLNVVPADMRA